MASVVLRKSGGSVIVTVPPTYLKEAGLTVGAVLRLEVQGNRLTISPARKKLTLSEILADAPKNAKAIRAKGWDEMAEAGNENLV